jgi:hypothetical protein
VIASEEMVERPIRTALSTHCADITRGHAMRHRSAGGTAHRPETGSFAQPTFSHEGCDGAGGFADNSIMAQSSPKNPTVTFHAIELDDFDSLYFANCDRSGRSPGSCSDRPCQYLYQSQSSLIARNRSRYPSSRNLYSSRLNYPAQLSRCCFLR